MVRTSSRLGSSQLDLSGPFFTHDPAKTFRQNIRVLMRAIADEAEADVVQQMQAGEASRAVISHGVRPARVSTHVVGRTVSLAGKPWEVTAVASVQNRGFSKAEGTALMAAAARVENTTHAFRRTTSRMRRAKAINTVELLKDIA